uniref:Cytochrome P450 n=1 Tax=Glossina brevipalpis TaxID=37001 RepID=A0A1A9WGR8_9MUSC
MIYMQYWQNYWQYKDIPHDRPRPLLEIFKTLSKYGIKEQVLEESKYYTKLYEKFKGSGPFCGFYHLLDTRVLVLDTEVMQQILIKNFSNFNERGYYHNISKDPLSADLFSLGGQIWQEMRLKLESLFHETNLKSYQKIMQRESEKLLIMLNKQNEDFLIDMKIFLHHYVLSTLASLVFGLKDEKWLQKYPLEKFDHMTHLALHTRRHDPYLSALMQRYPKIFRRFGFSTTSLDVHNYFHALLSEVLSERETNSEVREDLLENLLSILIQELHTHEIENLRDPPQLKTHLLNELLAQAFTFLRAGLEPTEKTLIYVLYELAKDLVLQQRVRDEILKQRKLNKNQCNYECIQSLKVLELIIKETLRLHPITPYLIRRTLSDYVVSSNSRYLIPKNTYVVIPIQALHQDSSFYTQPKLFNPQRFNASDNDSARESMLWFGYGMGPRNCVGSRFAQLQILTLLTFLLSEYEFSLDAHQQLNEDSAETLPLKIKSLNRRSEYVEYVEGVESLVE